MTHRRKRGISIVELLIGIGLFGLISTSLGILVRNGLEYLRMAEVKAELSRQSLYALSMVSRELAESNPDAIRQSSVGEPPGLVFASPRSGSSGITYQNNRLQWKRWICLYWDQPNNRLVRLVEEFSSPTTFIPDPFPAGSDRSTLNMSTSVAVARRMMARNVTNFSTTGTQQVTITLEVQAGEGPRLSKLTTQTAVAPRH